MTTQRPPRPTWERGAIRHIPTLEEVQDAKRRQAEFEATMAEAAKEKAKASQEREAKRAAIHSEFELFLARLPEETSEQLVTSIMIGGSCPQSFLQVWGDRDEAIAVNSNFVFEKTSEFAGCTNERCYHHAHDAGAWYYRLYSNENQERELFFLVEYEQHNHSLRQPGSHDGVTRSYLHVDLDREDVQVVSICNMDGRYTRLMIEEA